MNANARPRFWIATGEPRGPLAAHCLAAILATVSGCAGFKLPDMSAEQNGVTREDRKQAAVQRFEESRDRAEHEAAAAAWERGDAKTCEETLARLLERNPRHRDARLLWVDVCLAGDRREEALAHVRAALEAYPDDAQALYALATVLDAIGRPDEALAHYERAARQEPDNELLAVAYYTARDGAQRPPAGAAAATLRVKPAIETPQAVATDRDGPANRAGGEAVQALFQRAEDALKRNAPEAALAFYREAAATNPDNPQILISAATTALRYDYPDAAVALLRPAERRFAQSAAVQRILGVAHYRLGDYRSSQVALQQALSLDKSSALSYFLMGCTLAKLGRPESAEEHFRQAQAIDPRYAARR